MIYETNINEDQLRGLREKGMKIPEVNFADKWRKMFRPRRRRHDPMLVLNMSVFNYTDGWDRTFNPRKTHENGTR